MCEIPLQGSCYPRIEYHSVIIELANLVIREPQVCTHEGHSFALRGSSKIRIDHDNVEIYWFAHVNSIHAFTQMVNMCKMSVLDVQLFRSLHISRTVLL